MKTYSNAMRFLVIAMAALVVSFLTFTGKKVEAIIDNDIADSFQMEEDDDNKPDSENDQEERRETKKKKKTTNLKMMKK